MRPYFSLANGMVSTKTEDRRKATQLLPAAKNALGKGDGELYDQRQFVAPTTERKDVWEGSGGAASHAGALSSRPSSFHETSL